MQVMYDVDGDFLELLHGTTVIPNKNKAEIL